MSAAISDLSSLAALAWDPSLDVRPALLRVQADLFANAPARDAQTVADFETLALGLLPGVDDAAALAVARILAPVEDTPASVIRFLVARGGDVARVMIGAAPKLPAGFHPVALARNPDWAGTVARRADLTGADVEELARLRDATADLALAENPAAPLGGRALAQLVDRARDRADLAEALLRRADLPATDRAALYLSASTAERDAIRGGIEASPSALRAVPLPRASREAGEALVAFAMARDVAGFEARLAGLLGLQRRLDPTGPGRDDLLALALVAAGIGEEECVRIFLTLDDRIARSVAIVFRLAEIVRSTPRSSAIRLLEAILDAPLELRRDARHQPGHGPSARTRPGLPGLARERTDAALPRVASGEGA
ncbi:DUF2336 domain-containing protein [Salinarimonas soli]|nr:hypothetical protein [Salinarimonas soli]